MKTYHSWLLMIMVAITVPLSGQNCFTRYFEEGRRYMAETNYEQAILNFLGTLNCPETTLEQRQQAGAELKKAIELNRQALEEAKDEAVVAKGEAIQAAQRADLRYRAYLAQRELELGNAENGLVLAFQSLKMSHTLGRQDPEIESLFGQAVWAHRAHRITEATLPPVFNAENTLLVAGDEGLHLYNPTDNTISSVEGLPAGKVLKVAGDDKSPYFLAFKEGVTPLIIHGTGKVAGLLTGLDAVPSAVAFSHDGNLAATGLEDGRVLVWRLPEGQLEATLVQGKGKVLEIEFAPDSRQLLSRNTRAAFLWDIKAASMAMEMAPQSNYLYKASFFGGGKQVATLDADGKALLWNTRSQESQQLAKDIRLMKVTPNQKQLLAINQEDMALVYGPGDQPFEKFPVQQVRSAGLSQDGSRLLLWAGNTVSLFSPEGKLLYQQVHSAQANHAAITPDGTQVITACNDGSISLYNTASGLMLSQGIDEAVQSVLFSPGGQSFAALSFDGEVWLCPTPAYQYQRMKESPPPVDAELLDKYGIE